MLNNLISSLGLKNVSINTTNVKDLSLLRVLTEFIRTNGGSIAYAAITFSDGSSAVRFPIKFLENGSKLPVVVVSHKANMTYTEFRKKYKHLPQFLEEWKKHKEANG